MGSANRRTIDCGWDSRKSGFVCTETTTVPLGWAERTYEQTFLLLSREVLELEGMNRLAAPSVEDVAARLRDGRAKLSEALGVPDVGPVTPIVSLPTSPNGAPRFLFATPGRLCDAAFRFYVASVPPSGNPVATLIASTRVGDNLDLKVSQAGDCADAEDLGTCTGPRAKFTVTQTFSASDRLCFLSVLVEEVKGRWVYLIGVDDRNEPPRTEALLLATDTAEYDHCAQYMFRPQLVSVSVSAKPFRATVEVEPGYRANWIDGQARRAELARSGRRSGATREIRHAQLATLLWTEGDGFVLLRHEQAPLNEDDARVIVIDDTGRITPQ